MDIHVEEFEKDPSGILLPYQRRWVNGAAGGEKKTFNHEWTRIIRGKEKDCVAAATIDRWPACESGSKLPHSIRFATPWPVVM